MLIFGPFRAIPEEDFVVFNLSSPTELVPILPGLFVQPMIDNNDDNAQFNFDMWYYNHCINDIQASSSIMSILNALYNGRKVYICIGDYSSDNGINIINESFMKMIQARYDIKYSIINNKEDYEYVNKDGCDFASVRGIEAFDLDRNRFDLLMEEHKIQSGIGGLK